MEPDEKKTPKQIADLYLAEQLELKGHEPSPVKPKIVEVPVEELRKLAGSYRRTDGLEKGFLVDVGVQEANLVFTSHFGRATRLAAIHPRQFRDSDAESDVTYHFSTKDGEPSGLTIKTESGVVQRYKAITVAHPTPNELAAYAGRFYCPELLTTYFISVKNDCLFLRINNRRPEELMPHGARRVRTKEPPHDRRRPRFSVQPQREWSTDQAAGSTLAKQRRLRSS